MKKRPLTPAESARAADWVHLVAPVVRSYARKRTLPAHLDPETLESHGLVGLMDAARLWTDAGKPEDEWIPYARGRIQAGLIDGLRAEDKRTRLQIRDDSGAKEVSDQISDDGSTISDNTAARPEPNYAEIRDELATARVKLRGRVAWLMEARYHKEISHREIASRLGISENRLQQVWTGIVGIARARINGRRGGALPFGRRVLDRLDAIIYRESRLRAARNYAARRRKDAAVRVKLNRASLACNARRRAGRQKALIAVDHVEGSSGKSCSCGWTGKRWALHDRWVKRWAESASP